MNISEYLKQRQQKKSSEFRHRELCPRCVQPGFSCYCPHLNPIDCKIKFVILIHPIEVRRRIATGRMAYLCLQNSVLIDGQDFSYNKQVNEIIQNPDHQSVVLYPGKESFNISSLPQVELQSLIQPRKQLVIFVIDGTWATAKKTMNRSENLKALPKICFTPQQLSQFRVRKQPDPNCFSTIEAIHQTIDLLGSSVGFSVQQRSHDHLLYVFDKMVQRQLEFIRLAELDPSRSHYRPRRFAVSEI